MEPFNFVGVGMAAVALDDIESMRKSAKNRLYALLRPIDLGGYGLSIHDSAVRNQAAHVTSLSCDAIQDSWSAEDKKKLAEGKRVEKIPTELANDFVVERQRGKPCCHEHTLIKTLEKEVKSCALGPWIEAQKGIGLKQAGRLLGVIGDPYWNSGHYDHPEGKLDSDGEVIRIPHDRPRTVSELWSYCGMGVVDGRAPHRRKNVQSSWNGDARMRIWNISGACLKAQGHYADVYYEARDKYADAVHSRECVRCGPSGKPALVGSPLSAAHQHACGLRIVSKTVLKDFWVESKRLHELLLVPMAA